MQERQSMQVTTALTTAQQHLLSPSPGIKGSANVSAINGGTDQTSEQLITNPSPSVVGSSYNVTRVKY